MRIEGGGAHRAGNGGGNDGAYAAHCVFLLRLSLSVPVPSASEAAVFSARSSADAPLFAFGVLTGGYGFPYIDGGRRLLRLSFRGAVFIRAYISAETVIEMLPSRPVKSAQGLLLWKKALCFPVCTTASKGSSAIPL